MPVASASFKQPSAVLKTAIESLAYQMVDEPEQRLNKAYYDGYQETDEVRAYREDLGIPADTTNLYKNQIDTVLGMQEQHLTDWMLKADDDSGEEMAEAGNVLMNEIMRMHDANHHCSEAYKPMIIAGLGWVYFGKNVDPLGLDYDLHTVASSEIIWDRRCRRLDMEDCQYIIRRRFLDEQQAVAFFPEHERLIADNFAADGDWGPVSHGEFSASGAFHTGVDGSQYPNQFFRSDSRPTIAAFDMYYRSWEERHIIFLSDGHKMEYDPDNAMHLEAILSGTARVKKRYISVMRNAWFIGQHLISDEVSPHPHRMFPYVMFRGHQEEGSNAVYGIGRQMIGPQDAFNRTHVQLAALMEKVTVIIKKGSLAGTDQTNEDVQREAHKGDGLIEIAEDGDVQILNHYEHIRFLVELKKASFEEMRAASGVSQALTGQEQSQKSGVALQGLVEQSMTTLAEINANFQFARRMLGRLVWAHVVEKIGQEYTEVNVKSATGQVKKTIKINEPAQNGSINNNFVMARMQVAMADIASSDGYRAQNMLMLKDTAVGAPEMMQPHLYLAMLKLSNLPDREELVADLQKQLGKGATEEEQEAMDQQNAEQAQADADLLVEERRAKIELDLAKAKEALAKAGQHQMDGEQKAMEADQAGAAANDEKHKRDKDFMAQLRGAVADRAVQAA